MLTNDQNLLRRFVELHDEAAFTELVQRHLGLALGTACRLLSGDRAGAEDLVQQVFLLLARKASSLLDHPCLGAWIYRATRLAGMELRRQRLRQQKREQEAVLRHQASGDSPLWQSVEPYLDDALDELEDKDREIILLRHIERQSGACIAARLGLSEIAARKQLERAMERLRVLLSKRGASVGALALAELLEKEAQAGFTSALVQQIASNALLEIAPMPTPHASVWTVSLRWGLAVSMLVGLSVWIYQRNPNAPISEAASIEAPTNHKIGQRAFRSNAATSTPQAIEERGSRFELRVLDKATRSFLTKGNVNFQCGPSLREFRPLATVALTNGVATVDWTNDCAHFLADVKVPGYAETRVQWIRESEVLPVPSFYELWLEPTRPIGGVVQDQQGNPLANCEVGVYANGEFFLPIPNTHQPALSYPLREMHLELKTDDAGHWSYPSMALAVQAEYLSLQVSHPNYKPFIGRAAPLVDLQNQTLTIQLQSQKLTSITGQVLDENGQPLADAEVTDGELFSNPGVSITGDQHIRTDREGKFAFPKTPRWRGKGFLTAKALNYAPQTLAWNGSPTVFRLHKGFPFRIRVLSKLGEPLPDIRVESSSMGIADSSETNSQSNYRLYGKTDNQGRVDFSNVPNQPFLVSFWSDSPHYQTLAGVLLKPTPEEQTVSLLPALIITGDVIDARTGKAIPAFRTTTQHCFGRGGIPNPDPFALPAAVSGTLQENGHFELELCPLGAPLSPNLRGPEDQQHLGTYLKITASGYAAYTSRFFDAREGQTNILVELEPKPNATVQVLNTNNQPVAGAEIRMGSPTCEPEAKKRFTAKGDYCLRSDENGRVVLPADDTLAWIFAFNPDKSLSTYSSLQKLAVSGSLRLVPTTSGSSE